MKAVRILLIGMVVYWLGGIVIPRLTSLAFPSVLDWRDLPAWLNPDAEIPAVVIPEAGILLVTALLALYAGWRDHLARRGWITVGGWLTLAFAAAVLGWLRYSVCKASPQVKTC